MPSRHVASHQTHPIIAQERFFAPHGLVLEQPQPQITLEQDQFNRPYRGR